jgi:hypothetical protein
MKNPGTDRQEHYMAFCDCSSEGVLVTRWKDDEYKEIYLSLWGYRPNYLMDWRERLRHIWRIIKVGYPFDDDVVLNPDSAKALGLKLIEYADEWIEKKRD